MLKKVTDLSDNLWKTVMDAHEGVMRGFPYQSAMLTEHVNGMALGNITMLSANSGIGKSFLTLAQILPNMIEFDEKLLIIANEEESRSGNGKLLSGQSITLSNLATLKRDVSTKVTLAKMNLLFLKRA